MGVAREMDMGCVAGCAVDGGFGDFPAKEEICRVGICVFGDEGELAV